MKSRFFSLLVVVLFLGVLPLNGAKAASFVFSLDEGSVQQSVQSAEQLEKNGDYNQAASAYNQAATASWELGNLRNALQYFDKALTMTLKIGNRNGAYVIHTNMGMVASEMGDYSLALSHFDSALGYARQLNRKNDVSASLINLGSAYFEKGDYKKSVSTLNEALNLALEQNDTKQMRNCYSLLAKASEKMGDIQKSTEYFNLFSALTSKIQKEEALRKDQQAKRIVDSATVRVQEVQRAKAATEVALLEKSVELQQKQQNLEVAEQISKEQQMQIDLLSKEKALQEAEINRNKLLRNIYLLIIVTILGFSGLILYNYNIKRKNYKILAQKNIEINRQKGEIEQQAEQLVELNALKDKLFSIISHDLRSPLYSLIGLLNLAKEGNLTEAEFRSFLSELSVNVGYNSALLENLLNWSKTQMQGMVVNPCEFNLFEIADSQMNFYHNRASDKGIGILNNVEDGVMVFADKDMIELVLRNLVGNAIKFCSKGDVITVNALRNSGVVVLTVKDTGRGIMPDDMAKLFGKQIFSKRGTNDEKGTGLGLILCKDFVTLNGGTIWAESELGKGSCFYVALPESCDIATGSAANSPLLLNSKSESTHNL
ncbi:MAG: tetratricopeptide repeat-containing sensor histidine kinase [Bacteroidales bacterium]|nr:tetratricopeptide repeat-containing sensor histidine kinase [Bacteroidales bacterium]MBN2750263.1 tetratricopeptide repeat-containing sensor histidine kinase [Bacteroidales bacterium]